MEDQETNGGLDMEEVREKYRKAMGFLDGMSRRKLMGLLGSAELIQEVQQKMVVLSGDPDLRECTAYHILVMILKELGANPEMEAALILSGLVEVIEESGLRDANNG